MNRLDVTHERVCMVTQKEECYMTLVENLIDHNDLHNVPLSNEKLRQAVGTVMSET